MNIVFRRKATAIVVTLALIAVIAVTGVLCAVTLNNKPNNDGDVVLEKTATYVDYGMKPVTYDLNKNVAYVYCKDKIESGNGGLGVMFPTEIYLDRSETLSSAGYYFGTEFWEQKKNLVTYYWWIYKSVFGAYKNDITGAGYGTNDNENTMNRLFSGYTVDGAFTGQSGSVSTGEDGPNSTKTGSQYKNNYWNLKMNGTTHVFAKFTFPSTTVLKSESEAPNGEYTFTAPTAVGLLYQRSTWTGGSKTQDIYSFDSGITATGDLTCSQDYLLNISSGYAYQSNINIKINIYNKADLYTAYNNLKSSISELRGFASDASVAEAQKLVDEADILLPLRETTQSKIKELTDKMNSFVFTVNKIATSYTGWEYGATGHTDKTYLENIVSGNLKYNSTYAKYFTVTIDRTLANQWTNGSDSDATKTVTNASTYTASGYVQDAGDYTIKFTPKTSLSDGMLHKVKWNDDTTATVTSTLTITRATAEAIAPTFDANKYNGSAHSYNWVAGTNGTITLKGGMTASTANTTIKLSKTNIGSATSSDWDNCGNTVSFTEVGTHKIYYRMEIKNHYGVGGDGNAYFEVTIDKASVQIVFTADSLYSTYGDPVLDATALADRTTTSSVNGIFVSKLTAGSVIGTGGPLSNLLKLGVKVNGVFPIDTNDNLSEVGTYSVEVKEFTAITDRSDTLVDENASVSNWGDRLNVTFVNNDYSIKRKSITLDWTYDATTEYNALAQAPTATVASGLVDGGEVFAPVVSVKDDGATPLKDGGAVWAGNYTATVENTSKNYEIPSPDCDFTINKKQLYLNVSDETAGYAQYIGDASSSFVVASDVLADYMDKFANSASSVFSFVDCAMAGSDDVLDVFVADIVGIDKTGDYYNAGTHTGALTLRLLTEQDDENANFYLIDSYNLNVTAGTFEITPASITTDVTEVRLTYNGTAQAYTLASTDFDLSGYEEQNKTKNDIVSIGYSTQANGPFNTTVTLTDYSAVGTVVYYQVKADNHNPLTYSFVAYMDKLSIEFNVGDQDIATNPVYYGDYVPDSEEIREHLSLSYTATNSDGSPSDYSIHGVLGFYLLKAGVKVEDGSNPTAGMYDLGVESINPTVSLNNFDITFAGRGSVGSFEISKRPLVVDWRQDGWEDGVKTVYTSYAITIFPTVRRYRTADLSYFDEHTNGEGTGGGMIPDHNGDMYVPNYVGSDSISLKEHTLSGQVRSYTFTTELTKTYNKENYELVNPEITYYITARDVAIVIYDQEATYGNVSNVLLGNLSTNKYRWDYYTGGATTNKFVNDKHSAYYMLSVDGFSHTLDVDVYPIVLSVDKASDTAGVTDNYNIIVYRKMLDGTVVESTMADSAKLTINKADFDLKQTTYYIDGSSADYSDVYRPMEYCDIDAEAIREIIRLVGGTTAQDVAVYLTEFSDNYPDEPTDDSAWLADRVVSINDENQIGNYYFYIKLTNKNYNDYTAVITVKRQTKWISITLGDEITAIYGDKLLSSDELFDALRANIKGIIGVMDGEDQITDAQEAWDMIKARGYFSLNVNNITDLDTVLPVGFYSIFIEVDDEKREGLYFRFATAENATQPSNVDIYEITKRPLYLKWEEDAQTEFQYGAETDIALYEVANLKNGDEVILEMFFGVDDSNGNPGDLENATVGDYVIYINQESLTHDNYRIAVVGDKKEDGSLITEADLSFKFSIVPRVITITFDKYDEETQEKLDNLTLTYGDDDARVENIAEFLNSANVYEIAEGDLGAFLASEVFEIKLVDDISAYDYIPAGKYVLTVDGKNKNFEVQYDGASLVINNADFIISYLEFAKAYYNGNDIKPDIIDETLDFGFIVAGDVHDKIYIEDEDGSWVALEDFRLKNAGTYTLNVKVTATNYNESTRLVDFTIEKADVTITLSSFEKEYGKILGSGDFATVISDYIKTNGKVSFAVSSNGNVITIDNIADKFIFYVVAGGALGVNGGQGVDEGNFANNVGAYRIYHEFADEVDSDNFNVTYADDCNAGAYVITPAKVDVEWLVDGVTVASGDKFVYIGDSLDMTARFKTVYFEDGEMKSDYNTLYISGGDGVDVKTYTAKASFSTTESNYTLNANTASFTYVIIARTLYIQIDSVNQTYGLTKAEILANFDNTAWSLTGYYNADGWSIAEDEFVEYLKDYISLSLDLSAYDDDAYVPYTDSAYRIYGSNTDTNFNVQFSDDQGAGATYGIFSIVRADIEYDRNATYQVTYDGTDQDIDFFDTLKNHITLQGDVEWTRDNVTITYVGYADGVLPTVKSEMKVIGFKISVANHKDLDTTITVTVKKATVVLMIDTTRFEYGSTDLTSEEICSAMNIAINKNAGDPINVDLFEVFDFAVDVDGVGSYALDITIKDANLAELIEWELDTDTEENHFVVFEKTVTVDWGNTTLTYNGEDQLFEALGFIGEVGNDKISAVTYSIVTDDGESSNFAKAVGEYRVKIEINSNLNPNYVISADDTFVTFTIAPKEIQIEWTQEDFVYDGEMHALSAKIVGGVLGGDEVNLTLSAGYRSAGTHITEAGVDNDNYAVSVADASRSFTIAPKEVELVWEVADAVYNQQVHLPVATAKGLVAGDICEVKVEIISGNGINAGRHTAQAVSISNSDYKLPAKVTYEFAIAQRELTSIIWTNTSLEYKEGNGIAVAQAPTAVGVGMLSGDDVTIDVSGAGTVVGSYTAKVSGVSNPNYTIGSTTANASVSFKITQAENSFDKELVLPETNGGLPSLEDFESVASKYGKATVKYYTDEACTQEYTGNLADASKGTYYVVVEVEGTDNYKGVSETFTVSVSASGSNAGLVVGIIIAVLAVIGAGVAIVLVVLKKKKKDDDDSDEDED